MILQRLFGDLRARLWTQYKSFSDFEDYAHTPGEGSGSALEEWYDAVRLTPIGTFSDFDLSRTIRQRLYLEQVLPLAFRRLRRDPNAGDLYDGEMANAVSGIHKQFWEQHADLHEKALALGLLKLPR
jgi:hypothetical protein